MESLKEWEKFRDIVMECTNDVCGMRRVGGQRRKGSEWCNEEVDRAVAEKTKAFEEWLQRRDRVTYDRYRAQRVAVKLAVQAAKRMADRLLEERLGNDFEGNKKMFWKEGKRVRKREQAREEMVKDVNGQILRNGVELRRRWAEYFEQVLNVADVRDANINVVITWRMPVFGDLNERAISLEEVGEALNEMKFLALWLGGFRIQPTFALVRVVRGDLPWDINCPIPPAHCMLGLFACSEAYEFGQLGTGLSWFG